MDIFFFSALGWLAGSDRFRYSTIGLTFLLRLSLHLPPRLLLGLALGPVPRLEPAHARLADVGVPGVEGVEVVGLDDGGELDFFALVAGLF